MTKMKYLSFMNRRIEEMMASSEVKMEVPECEPPGENYFYMNREMLGSRPSSRRIKRLVPDSDKDNRYWEKRKRNNEAARRSRENKRRLDMDVRQRIVLLEDDNSLLRKELSVIKVKYGLSLDQKYLSVDTQGELIATSMPDYYLTPPSSQDGASCRGSSLSDNSELLDRGSPSPQRSYSSVTHNNDEESPRIAGSKYSMEAEHAHMPMKKRIMMKSDHEDAITSVALTSPPLAETTLPGYFPSTLAYPHMMWSQLNSQAHLYPHSAHLQAPALAGLSPDVALPPISNTFASRPDSGRLLNHSHVQPAFRSYPVYEPPRPQISPPMPLTPPTDRSPHQERELDLLKDDAVAEKQITPAPLPERADVREQTHGDDYSQYCHKKLLQRQRHAETNSSSSESSENSHEAPRTTKASDELMRENNAIRNQLQQLSNEVEKMKSYIHDSCQEDGGSSH